MVVVHRVSVVGNSGSGKSTLAAALAAHLDAPWIELDSIYHQPGWNPLPGHLVMRRIIGRTFRRAAHRQELWNGNREPWSNWLTLDPERSIIMWSWTQHAKYRVRYAEAMADPALAHLTFIRLRSPAEVRAFLSG